MQTRMQVRSEIDLNSLICSKSTSGSGASPARASVKPREAVLSPSSFLLENFNAEEWVLVRRRRRRASISAASSTSKVNFSRRCNDPRQSMMSLNLKSYGQVGPATSALHASPVTILQGHTGPGSVAQSRSNRIDSAGRSLRCLLGYGWRTDQSRAPIIPSLVASGTMANLGGGRGGGFDPGVVGDGHGYPAQAHGSGGGAGRGGAPPQAHGYGGGAPAMAFGRGQGQGSGAAPDRGSGYGSGGEAHGGGYGDFHPGRWAAGHYGGGGRYGGGGYRRRYEFRAGRGDYRGGRGAYNGNARGCGAYAGGGRGSGGRNIPYSYSADESSARGGAAGGAQMSATSVATVVASAGGHPHLAEPQAAQEMPVVQAQVTAALPAASAGLDAADVPSAVVQQRAQEKAPDFIPLEPVIVNVAGSSSGSNNAAAVATKTGKRKDKVRIGLSMRTLVWAW